MVKAAPPPRPVSPAAGPEFRAEVGTSWPSWARIAPASPALIGLSRRLSSGRADDWKGRRALVRSTARETLAQPWRRRSLASSGRDARQSSPGGVCRGLIEVSCLRSRSDRLSIPDRHLHQTRGQIRLYAEARPLQTAQTNGLQRKLAAAGRRHRAPKPTRPFHPV